MPIQIEHLQADESIFIHHLQQGDQDAFAHLYDRYAGMMLGVIHKIVPELADAENLLQDCFVKVWRFIDSYDATRGKLSTWLLNIARNTAIDFLRSRMYAERQKHQRIDQVTNSSREPAQAENSIDTIGLRELVQKVSAPYREIILWMYFEGYTQQEIADKFNLPLGTVKTRTRMALRELRTAFDLI
ncbi:MAG: RNA polymerase sigma factor [Saprospiraceae bacterium]